MHGALATPARGLTDAQAKALLAQFGPNVIAYHGSRSAAVEYLLHFRNPLVLLLIGASAILGWTGDVTSMTIIIAIVIASVTLDFVQEHRASRALARLQATVAATAIVVREDGRKRIPVALLVPGDLVLLTAGDVIAADGDLVAGERLFVNEAALSGESYPVEKAATAAPGDRRRLVYMGTAVVSGTGEFIVQSTGASTALGSLATALVTPGALPPLERGVRQFGIMILRLTLFLVLFVLLVNAAFHRAWLESFLFAVALAVGLTPELLPMIVSVTLARGALRLARRHVIVKRPSAIYALGGMDVFCTDKTGTLTEGAIQVAAAEDFQQAPSQPVLALAAANSAFVTGVRSPLDDALLAALPRAGEAFAKRDEVAFDFSRRIASVLVQQADDAMLIVKGAPEEVVGRCTLRTDAQGNSGPLDSDDRTLLIERFASLGDRGFRVLAVATRPLPDCDRVQPVDENALTFRGFVTFVDPPRRDAATALTSLAHAGIAVKIVTGDDERVARHVCATLGLHVAGSLAGRDIDALTDEALADAASGVTLFSRVSPSQKTRVIRALQSRGNVVGFMGDGINDAPAMHAADVGISVESAAGVAREAADVILTRRRLHVVHDGVLEGRRTYTNIMKYLMMVTSSNFGNMLSMAMATLFLPFLPMLPAQILLNNLLYDLSETAIPLDRVEDVELRRPHVFDVNEIRRFMLLMGPVSSVFDLVTFGLLLLLNATPALFQTGWFMESIATQVLVIFVIRTRGSPLRSRPHPLLVATSFGVVVIGVALPFLPLGALFGFVAPPAPFAVVLVVLVAIYLALAQLVKTRVYRIAERRRQRRLHPLPGGRARSR